MPRQHVKHLFCRTTGRQAYRLHPLRVIKGAPGTLSDAIEEQDRLRVARFRRPMWCGAVIFIDSLKRAGYDPPSTVSDFMYPTFVLNPTRGSLSHEDLHKGRVECEPLWVNSIHATDLNNEAESCQAVLAVLSPHPKITYPSIVHLPAEIIHLILHQLTMGQLRCCQSVSRQFRRAVRTVCMDKLSGFGPQYGLTGYCHDAPSTALSLWWHHALAPWSSSHGVQLQCIKVERTLEQLYYLPVNNTDCSIMIDITPEPTLLDPFSRPMKLSENFSDDSMLEQARAARYKGPVMGLNYFDYCTGKRTHPGRRSDPLAYTLQDFSAEASSSSSLSAQVDRQGSGQCFSVIGISHDAWSKTMAPSVACYKPSTPGDMTADEGMQRMPMRCLLPESGCDVRSTDQQQRGGRSDLELGVQTQGVLPGCVSVNKAGRSPLHCHAIRALSPSCRRLSSQFTCFCCLHHSPFFDEDGDRSVPMPFSVPHEMRCETEAWSVEYSVRQETSSCRSCASEPQSRPSRRRHLVRVDVRRFRASLDFVLSGPLA